MIDNSYTEKREINMSYEVVKIKEETEESDHLDELVNKLDDLKLRLTPLEPLLLKHKIDKEEEIVFDPPIRSKLLIYSEPYEKVIVYNKQLFEVVSIKTYSNPECYEPALTIRSSSSSTSSTIPLSFSELLAFLFYTGGYDQIRYKSYEEDNELINVILDVGELVYNRQIPQVQNDIKSSDYMITYAIRLNKPTSKTSYIGISVEDRRYYSYPLHLLNEELKKIARVSVVRYKYDAIDPIWIKIITFNEMSIVRNMLETLNKERNEIEKYITSLRLAYIGTSAYNSILR